MKNKIFYKGGSLNLSVDKILSMVALRTSVFVSESNQVEPNKRVYVKYESVDSSILESMIFKVLRLAVDNVYNLQIFRFIAFFCCCCSFWCFYFHHYHLLDCYMLLVSMQDNNCSPT